MINLFMLCCACGFSACAGLSALQEDNQPGFKQQEKVDFKQDNKKFVSYNDEDNEITLSYSELNYVFNNLSSWFDEESGEYIEIGYNISSLEGFNSFGYSFIFDEYDGTYITWSNNDNYGNYVANIYFDKDSSNFNFEARNGVNSFDSFIENVNLLLIIGSDYYEGVKTAIELDIQANTTGQEDYQNALGQFVQILVGGIQSLATGVASGIVGMASALFLETDNGSVTGLSVFGGIVAIFAGLALAIALTTKVYTWVTSLGN